MTKNLKEKFDRPQHQKDDGHAHIKFGQDPKPHLRKYGYCVVENVFTHKECDETIDEMWKWLEGLGTGIKRNDKTTWKGDNWPINLHQGMLQHTLGQEEFMWKVREHVNVQYIFQQIFGTFNLLVSFDGATIGKPPEAGHSTSPKHSWLHTDQNIIPRVKPEKVPLTDHYSVQGIANFESVGDDDAGLFLGEGTHLLHSQLFKHNGKTPSGNWYLMEKSDIDWFINKGVKFTKVNAPKGSFILFDSREAHQGFPAQKGRDEEKFRYVIYVAMTPAKRATEKDLEMKKKAIQKGRTTSHWSSNNIKIFPLPRTYGASFDYLTREKNKPDYEKWSHNRKKLAGLIKY